MLQVEAPGDFVLATGETHTVREFCERAFAAAGLALRWEGAGAEERGYAAAGAAAEGAAAARAPPLVAIDPAYYRPTEVDLLLGDPAKARRELGWQATTRFADLVTEMVAADLALVDRGELNA